MSYRSPRRIALIVHNLDALGGMERQAARLAERFAARGIGVTVVTSRIEPPLGFPPSPMKPLCERRSPIEIVRAPVFGNWTPAMARRLTELVAVWVIMRRRRCIQAIYAVPFTGARHAVAAARVTGLPTVVKFAGGGEHGDFHSIAKLEEAAEIRAELRSMDRFVIISEQIETEAETAGLDRARFARIPNGVDVRAFSPRGRVAEIPAFGPPGMTKVILFVGRLGPEKRLDVLLRAFAKTLLQVPEARLALAGAGPLLDPLHALVRELGIAEKVAFLGRRSDVDALHRASSVFVLPSASEGLPNALLEALACGTPAVATEIPGTTDVVRHEKEALLVPVGDVEALAAAMVRLLCDRELACRLADAGRARVADEFDMERVADRYVALFSELAPAARPSDLAIQARFVRALAWPSVTLLLRIAMIQLRDAITAIVVSTKRSLGIEGEVMRRTRRGSSESPRLAERLPASTARGS